MDQLRLGNCRARSDGICGHLEEAAACGSAASKRRIADKVAYAEEINRKFPNREFFLLLLLFFAEKK
ncbi:MAG: hypothetical protein KJ941_01325, partial [Bacteroidetes bacterium]|nr:hypothetical protein [Bacteroidota bacterium]